MHVGAPSGGSIISGEPRVIGTTAHEQLIICCVQVGAPSGGSLIPGEPGVMGRPAQAQQLISDQSGSRNVELYRKNLDLIGCRKTNIFGASGIFRQNIIAYFI